MSPGSIYIYSNFTLRYRGSVYNQRYHTHFHTAPSPVQTLHFSFL